MNKKVCKLCKENKPVGEYYVSSSTDDGLNRYCKQCCKVNRGSESIRKRDKRSKVSIRQLYRARQHKCKIDEDVTLSKIYRRDLGICHICRTWVQPKHASMDHVVPIVKGGDHTWDNVRLSHLKCNLKKGDR